MLRGKFINLFSLAHQINMQKIEALALMSHCLN